MGARSPRLLSLGAIGGIAVYVALDVALVFLRPSFSVLRSAESDYGSRGPYDWVMDANFVLRCALSLAVVVALWTVAADRRSLRLGLGLLCLWAVGSGLLAAFPDDPAGTTLETSGRIHLALAGIAFLAILVGAFLITHGLRRDERFASVRMPLLLLALAAVVALLLLGHSGLRAHHSLGGLFEKIFLSCELAFLGLLAARIATLPRPGEHP